MVAKKFCLKVHTTLHQEPHGSQATQLLLECQSSKDTMSSEGVFFLKWSTFVDQTKWATFVDQPKWATFVDQPKWATFVDQTKWSTFVDQI